MGRTFVIGTNATGDGFTVTGVTPNLVGAFNNNAPIGFGAPSAGFELPGASIKGFEA